MARYEIHNIHILQRYNASGCSYVERMATEEERKRYGITSVPKAKKAEAPKHEKRIKIDYDTVLQLAVKYGIGQEAHAKIAQELGIPEKKLTNFMYKKRIATQARAIVNKET